MVWMPSHHRWDICVIGGHTHLVHSIAVYIGTITEAYVGLLKVFMHRGLNRGMNVLNSIPVRRSCC
jgi:hypothetical protein